jgi:hypothetical protein
MPAIPENFGFNTDPLFVRAGQDGVAVPRGLAGVQSTQGAPAFINFRSDKPYETPADSLGGQQLLPSFEAHWMLR